MAKACGLGAFDRCLDAEEYRQNVEWGKPPAQERITAIKPSGGKVSLTHPYQIEIGNEELDKLVGEPTEQGLDAIECCCPKYTRLKHCNLSTAPQKGI